MSLPHSVAAGHDSARACARPRRVFLIRDGHVGWGAVDTSLARLAWVEVIGEAATFAEAADEVSRLAPDFVLAPSQIDGMPAPPIVAELSRAVPESHWAIFGSAFTRAELAELRDCRVRGLLVWERLSRDQLEPLLLTILADKFVWDDEAAELLRRPDDEPPATHAPAGHTLSQPDLVILRALQQGRTYGEIAVEVILATRTVERCIADLRAHFGVETTKQLIAAFARLERD